jgi:hypothetical protein
MKVKVTLCARDTKTTVSARIYRLRNQRDLNERFLFYYSNIGRLDTIKKEFASSINQNTNGYRKLIDTYFEPYD